MTSLTALGLRTLNRFASWPGLDSLRLRKPTEKVLYHGSKTGFRFATAASRAFKAISSLGQPARLPKRGGGELFDLTPTEEQQMIVDAVSAFAKEQLLPAASAADTACAAPSDLLAQCAGLGITQMGIPEALGGVGSERSAVTNVLIASAMAQGDMGLAYACLAPSAVSSALSQWGSAQQQAAYLPSFCEDTPPAAALAVLEPTPLFDPYTLSTQARAVNGGYELSGVKSMVALAGTAELFIVAAHIEGRGPALFIIESSTSGLSVEREPAMGLRAASTCRLVMDKVMLPATALLGERLGDEQAQTYAECIQLARLGWCALAVGCAQSVQDYLVPYVNERVAFGEPISHRQAVAFTVANMAIEINAMRLLTWRAASLADAGLPFFEAAGLARRLCADKGSAIGSDGVQLLGGHGFVKEHPAERWYRDLRATGVMEGGLLV